MSELTVWYAVDVDNPADHNQDDPPLFMSEESAKKWCKDNTDPDAYYPEEWQIRKVKVKP